MCRVLGGFSPTSDEPPLRWFRDCFSSDGASLVAQLVKNGCNSGDLGLIPGSGRSPGEGNGNPLQYSCLENPHGQKRKAGYCPWDHKESATTERLILSLSPLISNCSAL